MSYKESIELKTKLLTFLFIEHQYDGAQMKIRDLR